MVLRISPLSCRVNEFSFQASAFVPCGASVPAKESNFQVCCEWFWLFWAAQFHSFGKAVGGRGLNPYFPSFSLSNSLRFLFSGRGEERIEIRGKLPFNSSSSCSGRALRAAKFVGCCLASWSTPFLSDKLVGQVVSASIGKRGGATADEDIGFPVFLESGAYKGDRRRSRWIDQERGLLWGFP